VEKSKIGPLADALAATNLQRAVQKYS